MLSLFKRNKIPITSAQLKERIAALEAELPQLQEAAAAASVAFFVEGGGNREAYSAARLGVRDRLDEIALLSEQLSVVEAEERVEAERVAEAAAVAQREADQRRLAEYVMKDFRAEARSVQVNMDRYLRAVDKLLSTAGRVERLCSLGLPAGEPRPLDRTLGNIVGARRVDPDLRISDILGTLDAERRYSVRKLVDRAFASGNADDLVNTVYALSDKLPGAIERQHQQRLNPPEVYEWRRPEWSGERISGLEFHEGAGMPWLPPPLEFPLPHERNRAAGAYTPSGFNGMSLPPSPDRENITVNGESSGEVDVAALDETLAPGGGPDPAAAVHEPELEPEREIPVVSGTAAGSGIPDEEQAGEGLDDPAYVAEARRQHVPPDV